MTKITDYQRKKLYAAEDHAFGGAAAWKVGEYTSLDECKEFAELIVNSVHWKKNKGWTRIKLKSGAGCKSASYRYQDRSVTLPKWARNRLVMIHEFAHYLTHKTSGCAESSVGHGTHFAGHYLSLVDELMGMDYSMKLLEEFEDRGVKYHFLK